MLKTINFSIEINAKPTDVWFVLWNKIHYNKWTEAFSEGGSFAISDWQIGSHVFFGNTNGDGIYAKICENTPNESMCFEHIGAVKNNEEQAPDPVWENALEKYKLSEKEGQTILEVRLDSPLDYVSYFESTFPKALENIKNQAEDFYIYISAEIYKPLDQVWEYYHVPKHIVNWNFADPSWHCPSSQNVLEIGKGFNHTMAAKDDSFRFDFEGTYAQIAPHKYTMYHIKGDDREVHTYFEEINGISTITSKFQAETENSPNLQYDGWQAILNNFKKYTESN